MNEPNDFLMDAVGTIKYLCRGRSLAELSGAEVFVIRTLAARIARGPSTCPVRDVDTFDKQALDIICQSNCAAITADTAVSIVEMAKVLTNDRGHDDLIPSNPLEKLTKRERQVLKMIARGYMNKQIADELGIGIRTVETHRTHTMRKLDIHNTAGLTRFALTTGLADLKWSQEHEEVA